MPTLGKKKKAWKIQRALMVELPGLGKPGALERRPYPPGQHGLARRKFSEYGLRLREKQKLIFNYGMREEQLRRFVARAKRSQSSDWMGTLIGLLESRLDNIVFRLGFASSIRAARQLVRHGKVLVNGKKTTIGSLTVLPGDRVELTADAYSGTVYGYAIARPRLMLADWLELEKKGDVYVGRLKAKPPADAIPFPFEHRLVAEHYSRI
jgi:small subunit ribosomal protein S4